MNKMKTFKEYIEELKHIDSQIEMASNILTEQRNKKAMLQEEIIKTMKEMGVGRAESDTHQLILGRRKSFRIINPIAFSSEFKKRNVPVQNYMREDIRAMQSIAREWIKRGEQVQGLEEEVKEYLSLKEKGKEDDNNEKE
ncbi:MAG TPA: hypothetical protein PLL26_05215 [Candidatus Dojkabacteria bacterium]|nr:hypothetical protein [Candidatus Dojkabacteria bacterium]